MQLKKQSMFNCLLSFLNYETVKIVEIKNWKIGLFHRLVQIPILAYVVGYVFFYQQAYQTKDQVVSAVTTKVKGIITAVPLPNSSQISYIFDEADIVKPPLENNAFFVMTHRILTMQQTLATCPAVGNVCLNDTDCDPSPDPVYENVGLKTGNCIQQPEKPSFCELLAWCPLENDTVTLSSPEKLYSMVANMTVFIKNEIIFPKFHISRSNRDAWVSTKPIGNCRYDQQDPVNKYCPIFRLSTILTGAKANEDIVIHGGSIGISISWLCNLDYNIKDCKPEYSFHQLGVKDKEKRMFNYRTAYYYRQNGTLYRDLSKVFGIRFSIFVLGEAGQFDTVTLLLNIGSGLALFGMASIVCDFMLLTCFGSRKFYQNVKFEVVQPSEMTETQKTAPMTDNESPEKEDCKQ